MKLVPNKHLLLDVPFQSTKYRKKNCVWTTKYKRLLELRVDQYAEMKTVFKLQSTRRLLSTTVRSAKPASTF